MVVVQQRAVTARRRWRHWWRGAFGCSGLGASVVPREDGGEHDNGESEGITTGSSRWPKMSYNSGEVELAGDNGEDKWQ